MAKRNWTEEELAFLAAIHDDPRNDDKRLAFADWLEGRGDPLGEFIRLQCQTYRVLKRPMKNQKWTWDCPIHTREFQLCREFSRNWIDELPRPLGYLEFHRGLPVGDFRYGMFTSIGEWDEVCRRRSPLLRVNVRVLTNDGFAERLAHPLMSRVNSLSLYAGERGSNGLNPWYIEEEAIRQLAGVPWLEKLESINIECRMYDRVIEFYDQAIAPRLQERLRQVRD